MSTMIVYYSRTGSTEMLSEILLEKTGADALVGIDELNPRSGILGFLRSMFDSFSKKLTPISPFPSNISKYDLIVVCTPVWCGSMASPIRSFLTKYGTYFKNVAYVAVGSSAKTDFEAVFDEMDAVCGKHRISQDKFFKDQINPHMFDSIS